jgi:hypothetical protein
LPQTEEIIPREALKKLGWIWNQGVAPNQIVNPLVSFGGRPRRSYFSNRIRLAELVAEGCAISPKGPLHTSPFGVYLYQHLIARGSGEHALYHIFNWTKAPKNPIVDRFPLLGVPRRAAPYPIVFVCNKSPFRGSHETEECVLLADRIRNSGGSATCVIYESDESSMIIASPQKVIDAVILGLQLPNDVIPSVVEFQNSVKVRRRIKM